MAENKLKYTDIAEEGLLSPLKKEFEDTIKLADKLIVVLQKNVEIAVALQQTQPLTNFQEITQAIDGAKKLTIAFDKLQKAEKIRNETKKTEQELSKAEVANLEIVRQKRAADNAEIKKLAKEQSDVNRVKKEEVQLTREQLIEIEKLKIQNAAARKEIKEMAQEALGNVDSYKQLTKQSDTLQRRFKTLAATFGINSKEARAARLEFEQVNNKLRAIDEQARDGRRNVGRYAESLKSLQAGLNKVGATAKNVAGSLGFIGLVSNLVNVVKEIDSLGDGLQLATSSISVVLTVLSERISKAFSSIGAVFEVQMLKIILNFQKVANVFGNFDREVVKTTIELARAQKEAQGFGNAFEGIGTEIESLLKKNKNYVLNIGDMQRAESALIKENARLTKSKAQLEAASTNATSSFEQQIQATIQLNKINIQMMKNELAIAKNNLTQAKLQIEVKKDNAEAELAYGNAVMAVATIEAAILQERVEGQNRVAELQRNAIRRNLDFYITDAENFRSAAQKIVEDDTQSFEQREKNLLAYQKSAEESFRLSSKAINDFQLEQGKQIIDFEALLNETSSERIEQQINASNLDKRLAKEALDILKDRRASIEGNAKAEQTLNTARKEAMQIQQDLAIQQEALAAMLEKDANAEQILIELEDKRFKNQIANQKALVSSTKQGSLERVKAEQELNNLLIQEQEKLYQSRVESQKKNDESRQKDLENQRKQTEQAVEFVQSLTQRQSELRLQALDLQATRQQQQQQRLLALSASGNRQVEEQLAVAEKKQAEIEARRQQEIQNQKRVELALAGVKLYAAKVSQGDSQPLASTIAEIAGLQAFIAALPRFYEGSELVANDLTPSMAGKDGYIVRVDGSERIISPSQNAAIGNMSNVELVEAAKQHRQTNGEQMAIKELKDGLFRVEQAIKEQPTYLGRDYDKTADAVVERVRRGNKLIRNHYSNKGFGAL